MIQPQEFARIYDSHIKQTISDKFSIPITELLVLSEDEHGAYYSTQEIDTWCCFVVGKENGFLYLVTAKVVKDGTELMQFKSDIIS